MNHSGRVPGCAGCYLSLCQTVPMLPGEEKINSFRCSPGRILVRFLLLQSNHWYGTLRNGCADEAIPSSGVWRVSSRDSNHARSSHSTVSGNRTVLARTSSKRTPPVPEHDVHVPFRTVHPTTWWLRLRHEKQQATAPGGGQAPCLSFSQRFEVSQRIRTGEINNVRWA